MKEISDTILNKVNYSFKQEMYDLEKVVSVSIKSKFNRKFNETKISLSRQLRIRLFIQSIRSCSNNQNEFNEYFNSKISI